MSPVRIESAARVLLAALFAFACKGEASPPDRASPPASAAPVRSDALPEIDASIEYPTDDLPQDPQVDAADPSAAKSELVQSAKDGFRVEEIAISGGALWWIERSIDSELHRVFRRELSGGEPEQVGQDGRYQSLSPLGKHVQVIGDLATDREKSGVWRVTGPGKQKLQKRYCREQSAGACYDIDDKLRVVRWPAGGGKQRVVTRPPPPEAKKASFAKLASDGTIVFRALQSPREKINYFDATLEPGAAPIMLHSVARIGSLWEAHDGFLYYSYESLAPDWLEQTMRIRPESGAQPEVVFGGVKVLRLFFDGDKVWAVYWTPKVRGQKSKTRLALMDFERGPVNDVMEFSWAPRMSQFHDGYFYWVAQDDIRRVPLGSESVWR